MKTLLNIPSRLAAFSAMAASAAMATAGIIALTHEQSGQTTIQGTIEHIHIGLFTTSVLLVILPIAYLASRAGKPKVAYVATFAALTLAVLTVYSNVTGEDASFFFAIAGPTNLAIFASLIVIGRGLYVEGLVAKPLAFLLPASWIFFLQGHDVGGPIITAGIWLTVGWLILNEQLGVRRLQPATA
jgi:hypothetical protein